MTTIHLNLDGVAPALAPLDQWIEACCERDSGWIGTAALYASWTAWTKEHKEFTGSVSRFSVALRRRGWVKLRSRDQKKQGFAGWRLK
jgi:hypothetical protein